MPAVAKTIAKKKPTISLQRTRNPLNEGQRVEIVRALQPVQCAGIELYLQLKNAHWNIRGANFSGLHTLFDDTAREVNEIADSLAERISILGGEPVATLQKLSLVPHLADAPVGMKVQEEFVKIIADRLSFYVQMLRDAEESFQKNYDPVSGDACIKAAGTLEKRLWMIESHLPTRV
ncbi:MAG: Dps family protein [Silvanigrellaceae bacterium]